MALTVGILLAVAFNFHRWVMKDQLTKTTDSFIDAIDYARNVAMTAHVRTELCPLGADHKTCGQDWSVGQLILDLNHQTVVRVFEAAPKEYRLIWRPGIIDYPYVRFMPTGFVQSGAQGSFYFCAEYSGSVSSRILLLRTGRARVVIGQFDVCDE